MTELQLTDALQQLNTLSASDLNRYKQAITEGGQTGFAYYFPHLLSYNKSDRSAVLLVEDEGSLCVFRWSAGDSRARLDIMLPPLPLNINVLQRCLERANDFNGDTSARVLKIDAKDADDIASMTQLRVKERKSQYLYSPQAFADISGGKFRTVRRMVNKVEALGDVQVSPYSAHHSDACLALLNRWSEYHRSTYGTMGGVGTSKRVIELANSLAEPDMLGEVILINNELVGFAFGGEIRPGYAAFSEAKCDVSIQGLSYFQRYSFMSKLTQFEQINDGPDVGRKGLAQLKNSLRPIGMHTEYRGKQV
jgi:hypothetical protein